MDLVSVLIQIVVGVIVLAPLLWISGRILAETGKAKFTDAVWIVVLGVVIGAIVGAFLGGLIAGNKVKIAAFAFLARANKPKHGSDCASGD